MKKKGDDAGEVDGSNEQFAEVRSPRFRGLQRDGNKRVVDGGWESGAGKQGLTDTH